MIIHLVNVLNRTRVTRIADAPKAFLIPISLVLFTTINEARPNNPRQAINIARKLAERVLINLVLNAVDALKS